MVIQSGLALPLLSDEVAAKIGATLPDRAPTRNPVDLAGGGEEDFHNFERTVRTLAMSGEVDAVLLTGYFGGYSQESLDFARRETQVAVEMAAAAAESGRALVVQTMYPASPSIRALRSRHVPVYADIQSAVHVLERLAEHADAPALGRAGCAGADAGILCSRRLLRSAKRNGDRRRAFRRGAPGEDSGGREGGRQGDRLPGGPQSPRLVSQVGYGWRAAWNRKRSRPDIGVEGDDRAPQAARLLGRADGGRRGWRRAHHRCTARRQLRSGRGGRHGRRPRRGPPGRRCRTGADDPEGGGGSDPLVAGSAAHGRDARTRGSGRRGGGAAAVALSRLGAEHTDFAEMEINPILVTRKGVVALDARIVPARKEPVPSGTLS